MKNNFFVLDDKQSKKKRKKIKRSIKHNLNRNVAVSLTFFCNKGFVRILIIFTGKYLCQSLSFDNVT